LYSKKYNTIHYRIFQIIKGYRLKKITDDVILLEIYSLLSSSYQYSLKEDLLMQAIWRKIKPADMPKVIEMKNNVKHNGKTAKTAAGKGNGEKTQRRFKLFENAGRNSGSSISLHDSIGGFSRGVVFNAHDEFFRLLPKYVEKYLLRHRKKNTSKDPYILKGALYIITTFITDNYKIISPDWKGSLAKREVTNIGFFVPEVDTIISTCLEDLRLRQAIA
jgi:hypothetical protein